MSENAPQIVEPSEDTRLTARGRERGQIARQGFGEQSLEKRDSAATAMAERARAEVQARYIVALQRPRDVLEFRVRLLDHCKRIGFAAKARYRKPVGNTTIEGPSIRFVETALASYGNVLPECSIVYEDDGQIVIRVTVTDLEANITHAAEATILKRVERSRPRAGQRVIGQRLNSRGEAVFIIEATDDDIANLKGARESKLLRNLGLRILPADVVDEAMELCVQTLKKGAAADPAAERKKLSDAFHALGISPGQLAVYLGHPLDQVQPAELVELREAYQAIRDGETTWAALVESKGGVQSDAGPAPAPARGVTGAKQQLKKRRGGDAPPVVDKGAAELDEIEREVAAIKSSLEQILSNPHWLPGLRERVAALPDGPERAGLETLLFDAEGELAAARRQDDLPEGGAP